MNADQNPALVEPDYHLPSSLTLVLPAGVDRDEILKGLVQAIQDVRTMLTCNAWRYQQVVEECDESGDHLRQALCRGQALATAHAASTIDQNIIEVFGLWDQVETQDPDPGGSSAPQTAPLGPGPAPARQPPASSPGHPAHSNHVMGESLAQLSGTGRLADDLYLLAHHDVTGKPYLQPRAAGLGLAGALLAELMFSGLIGLETDRIVVADRTLPKNELARSILKLVTAEPEHRTARDWLLFLGRTAVEDVARRLALSGYLTRASSRRLWRGERWAPVDSNCAFAPVLRVKSALDSSQHATVQNTVLAGLAVACGLHRHLALYLPPEIHHRLQTAVQQLNPSLRGLVAQTQATVDTALLSHRV